jgi:hypothetical protein
MENIAIKEKIEVKKCIYDEKEYSFVDISKELIGTSLLKDAMYNGVLNINALYKNFIDDSFEHDSEVEDTRLEETFFDDDTCCITFYSLDGNGKKIRSYYIKIRKLKNNMIYCK